MVKITYRKLKTGNYVGRCGKKYIFIFKRPHGKWCAWVSYKDKDGETCGQMQGFFGTSLPTIKKAKEWARNTLLDTVKIENEINL